MGDMVSIMSEGKHEYLALASYSKLLEQGPKALQTELAILDINLGENLPNGLDAAEWLRKNRYKGRIIFLTGHGRFHPLVREAVSRGQHEVLEKPLELSKLFDIISVQKAA